MRTQKRQLKEEFFQTKPNPESVPLAGYVFEKKWNISTYCKTGTNEYASFCNAENLYLKTYT